MCTLDECVIGSGRTVGRKNSRFIAFKCQLKWVVKRKHKTNSILLKMVREYENDYDV